MTETTTGRLVEHWIPGGATRLESLRTWLSRHRIAVVIAVVAVLIAIGITIFATARAPTEEAPPPLPSAISAVPAPPTSSSAMVISVVGKVATPGLVTLTSGARVDDAIKAAGGLLPGTDDTALNLARRLTDGEQIYVGIPTPADADTIPAPDSPGNPTPANRKGAKTPTAPVNLNTATTDQLQTLPGIGPAMAQRILTWRAQHGRFDSISQLREVTGIGDARFAKLQKLVTT